MSCHLIFVSSSSLLSLINAIHLIPQRYSDSSVISLQANISLHTSVWKVQLPLQFSGTAKGKTLAEWTVKIPQNLSTTMTFSLCCRKNQ